MQIEFAVDSRSDLIQTVRLCRRAHYTCYILRSTNVRPIRPIWRQQTVYPMLHTDLHLVRLCHRRHVDVIPEHSENNCSNCIHGWTQLNNDCCSQTPRREYVSPLCTRRLPCPCDYGLARMTCHLTHLRLRRWRSRQWEHTSTHSIQNQGKQPVELNLTVPWRVSPFLRREHDPKSSIWILALSGSVYLVCFRHTPEAKVIHYLKWVYSYLAYWVICVPFLPPLLIVMRWFRLRALARLFPLIPKQVLPSPNFVYGRFRKTLSSSR
jgi:hypothetical protein